jgi:transposase
MEVIICFVYITHIVTGKVLSPSCQQLVTKYMCLYIIHAFVDSIAECRHSQIVTVSNLLLRVSLQGSTQHCNTFDWHFQ